MFGVDDDFGAKIEEGELDYGTSKTEAMVGLSSFGGAGEVLMVCWKG